MKQRSTNKMCDFPRSPSAKKIFAFEASVKIEKCEKNSVSTCIASPMRWCVHRSLLMQFNEQNLDEETAFFESKRRQAESGKNATAWFIANLWTLWSASLLTFLGFQGNISNEISTPYGLRLFWCGDDVFSVTSPQEQWTERDTTMNWTYLNCRYSNELNMIFVCILMIRVRERTMNCISEMLFLSNFHR